MSTVLLAIYTGLVIQLIIQPIFALNVKQSSIKLISSLIHWI